MSKKEKQIVREKYTELLVQASKACCSPSCFSPELESQFNEEYHHIEGYYQDADLGLGCGIPTEFISINRGDTVLDLGSGAGNDVFVARQMTGPEGRVIGLDMTVAMIEKANENKKKLGLDNVEFVLGDIEDMPVETGSIDVVISNCVLNLVPDKEKAYREIYRVLKSGGRFSISDIVIEGEMTENLKNVAALYAGCISGAIGKETYLQLIKNAGFNRLDITKEREIHIPEAILVPYATQTEIQLFREKKIRVFSLNICAEKE